MNKGDIITPASVAAIGARWEGLVAYASTVLTWRQYSGRQVDGTPNYRDSQILVVWDEKDRLVRNAKGEEIVAGGRAMTTAAVRAGDALVDELGRTWRVVDLTIHRDWLGTERWREVFVG